MFNGTELMKQACVQIFNDEVNERNEVFIAVLLVDTALTDQSIDVGFVPSRRAALLQIIDDDCEH